MDLVSIIIPVYNSEDYLAPCLESVLSQTYQNIEIIIVDDGSNDTSVQICKRYASDKRVKLFEEKHIGVASARNRGLDRASGNFIMYVDSDDRIAPDTIKIGLKLIQKLNAQIVQYGVLDCKINDAIKSDSPNKIKYKIYNSHQIIKRLYSSYGRYYVPPTGKLYTRDLFNGLRYPPGKKFEDEFLCYQLLYKANQTIEIENIYYYYTERDNSQSRSMTLRDLLFRIEALKERCLFFKKYNDIDSLNLSYHEFLRSAIDLGAVAIKYQDPYVLKISVRELYHLFGQIKQHLCVIAYFKTRCYCTFPKYYCAMMNIYRQIRNYQFDETTGWMRYRG